MAIQGASHAGAAGRDVQPARIVLRPGRVVEVRRCMVGDEPMPLRVEYRPAVTLSRWQRVTLAALYGVDLAPGRGGRLLAAVLSPLAWLFRR